MKFVCLLFLLLTFWLPWPAQESASSVDTEKQSRAIESVIMFQHSGNPSYKIYLANDRALVYEGIANVKTKGKILTEITDEQFQQLLSAFKDAKFSSLGRAYDFKNGCTAGLSEGPWITLTFQTGKKVKSIKHDMGCKWGDEKFVREMNTLTQLERRINEILNIEQWIGTQEERNKLQNPLALPRKNT